MTDDADSTRPVPRPAAAQPRIGDAERDLAVGYLQEHMAQGRLDRLEFDERLGQALSARTEADLLPLFDDLPEPKPSGALEPTSNPFTASTSGGAHAVAREAADPARTPRWVQVVMAAIWPAAVLLCLAIGFENWWVWVAAAMVTYFLRSAFVPDKPSTDEQRAIDQ